MFVYVLGPVEGPQKIGISVAPNVRFQTMQAANAVELKCWYTVEVPTDLARSIELYAHALLIDARVRGEWFNVSVEDAIAAINKAVAAVAAGSRAKDIAKKTKTSAQLNVRIPKSLAIKLKYVSFVTNRQQQDLLAEALRSVLDAELQ